MNNTIVSQTTAEVNATRYWGGSPSEDLLQHPNFVSPQRDIRLGQLPADCFPVVVAALYARFPALAELHAAKQLQCINCSGQFRMAPIRGGQLPADVTADAVAETIRTALAQVAGPAKDWRNVLGAEVATL